MRYQGFDVTTFAHAGRGHEVYRAGTGPAVVVVHEMPGLHPGMTAFGQRLVDTGYRVYLPSLFGRPGRPFSGRELGRSIGQVCVSREFVDLARVKARAGDGLCVLGLRFSADRGSPAERFATLRRERGKNFETIEIDSSPGNPYGIRKGAHAVLTEELVDTPGHPTRAALDRVMAFLAERLRP